jgi:hypothetical protein
LFPATAGFEDDCWSPNCGALCRVPAIRDAAQAHDTLTMTQSGLRTAATPSVERTRHPVESLREVRSIIGAAENPGDMQDLSLPVGSRYFYQAIDIF